ncbi:MAG: lipase family protein [Timaviella obliquedivisa GSE-PSE-MK23-08B]|jgi:triacylglycerol lipase|nr:lipase family protein [Timaviella obliquedivisa GSE-PSE-MK23-08B]
MVQNEWFKTFDFDAHTGQYSSKNALACGKLSWLAYYAKDEIREVLKSWNFTKFRFFDLGVTQAFVVADAEKIILTFRGTDCMKDWLGNFDIDLVGGPFGGKVHEGFSRSLSLIWKDIQLTFDLLQPRRIATQTEMVQGDLKTTKAPSLWVTGHSLGAALATLSVARLREKDQMVHGLYTFGSPRVGDRKFQEEYNSDFRSRTFRFVSKNDAVTRVPMRTLFYSHVGQLFYIDDDETIHTDPSFWYRFVDGIEVRLKDIADLDLSTIENHKIEYYVRALEKNKALKIEDFA